MISDELYSFLLRFFEENMSVSLNYSKLNQGTTLEEIGVEDLDFDLLVSGFVEVFEIDHSKFDPKRYFGIGIPLIDNNINVIKKIIGKFNWMPLSKEEREPFTLGILESALKTGVLV